LLNKRSLPPNASAREWFSDTGPSLCVAVAARSKPLFARLATMISSRRALTFGDRPRLFGNL